MYLNYKSSEVNSVTFFWLTLTWDVFKYYFKSQRFNIRTWLTLTWDVFKFA